MCSPRSVTTRGDTEDHQSAAAGPSGRASINPGTYYEANSGDSEDHQYNMTIFIAVLALETSNTMSVETYPTTALRQMGIVLTNEVYIGVHIPDEHGGQEMINQSHIKNKKTSSQDIRFSGNNHSISGYSPHCHLL